MRIQALGSGEAMNPALAVPMTAAGRACHPSGTIALTWPAVTRENGDAEAWTVSGGSTTPGSTAPGVEHPAPKKAIAAPTMIFRIRDQPRG